MTNRTILQGLKTRLGQAKSQWVDELYSVLWSYRTTSWILIRETPFKLAFRIKAIISMKISLPSTQIEQYNEINSDKRRTDLDLLDKTWRQVQLRMASYQQWIARYYNS